MVESGRASKWATFEASALTKQANNAIQILGIKSLPLAGTETSSIHLYCCTTGVLTAHPLVGLEHCVCLGFLEKLVGYQHKMCQWFSAPNVLTNKHFLAVISSRAFWWVRMGSLVIGLEVITGPCRAHTFSLTEQLAGTTYLAVLSLVRLSVSPVVMAMLILLPIQNLVTEVTIPTPPQGGA
jgi:hypothetical protein